VTAAVDRGVDVPMRDGVTLRADVYRPQRAGPVPAIVLRTPYDRRFPLTPHAALDPERVVEAGLALVVQDVRGVHESDGDFKPFFHESADGYDTVEWTAAQPWCDGAVGMAGRSYCGATQWLAAAERPPALRAIAPVVIGSNFFHGWVYQGGAFQLGFNLFWVHMMSGRKRRDSLSMQFEHLPLKEPPLLDEEVAGEFYRDWLSHSTDDAYWQQLAINRRYERTQVPAFIVGGWYDVFLGGTLENFAGLRARGGSEVARTGTRLLIGPWAHGSAYGTYPDQSFAQFEGVDKIDVEAEQLRFFAAHLAGGAPPEAPPVRLFVMGANRWRDEDGWPLARARDTNFYLRAGGGLSAEPPGEEQPDGYVYDPADPAPTRGGQTSLPGKFLQTNSGPLDQSELEQREDVLVYSSEPLDAPLEVTGPLTAVLWAATSAADTDFVVKLCDVTPEGYARILAEGVIRTRFREGYEQPRPITPGEVLDYRVDLMATSNTFLAGHRIRVIVTSSSFPRFDRNTNTGRRLGDDRPEDIVTARQTIFHDGARPSHIVLPVVPS
jgi:putative CocE/NonD family hydrolase